MEKNLALKGDYNQVNFASSIRDVCFKVPINPNAVIAAGTLDLQAKTSLKTLHL